MLKYAMSAEFTPGEIETINYYNHNAESWVANYMTHNYWGKLDKYFELLRKGGKVLEIGCGGGKDAKDYLIGKYDYTGTDVSEGLLKQARKYNPGEKFLKQSVYNLDFPDDTFDGFWAAAVLLHIPKYKITDALGSIHRVVKKDGVGLITLVEGEGEKADQHGRHYYFYLKDEFDKKLDNKFKIVDFNKFGSKERSAWLIYTLQVI